jgi:hypothetical protein
MDPKPRRWSRWLLIGCIGLPVAVLSLQAVLVVIARPWSGRPLEPVQGLAEHPLPVETAASRIAPEAARAADSSGPVVAHPEPGGSRRHLPGMIVLDVLGAHLVVEPGPPGSALRLESESDPELFRLLEELTETPEGWTYRLTHRPRGGPLVMYRTTQLKGNRLRLVVPQGVPLALAAKVAGESRLELGGLDLSAVELDLGMGDHELGFSSPTPRPLTLLRLTASTCAVRIFGVGEASPGTTQVRHRIGRLDVDLDGAWRTDGVVRVRFGLGDAKITVPETVELVLEEVRLDAGERHISTRTPARHGETRPRLHLYATGRLGELTIR